MGLRQKNYFLILFKKEMRISEEPGVTGNYL